jgi:sugar diacid utilization regulator
VGADEEPRSDEQFALRVLAQQTGIALANARQNARERAATLELRAANDALGTATAALESTMAIHERLTRVAIRREGQEGIAQAVHELTRYPVVVEDRHGNLRAWAGPGRPDPYPKAAPADRAQMLRRAIDKGGAIRDADRLLVVARPREDVLGVLALVDPDATASSQAQIALEHGATVLAMELARLHSLAETETRLRRDLVDDLLSGIDEESAFARAMLLGYDLDRPHRVVIVDAQDRNAALFHAVRRAARDTGVGSLLGGRSGQVVVLSDADHPWEAFRQAVLVELRGSRCWVGVGGKAAKPADLPRSWREACFALRMQQAARAPDQASVFDDLGIFGLLVDVREPAAVEGFVQDWLGALLEYDAHKGSELVATLSTYLEAGRSHESAARALAVHRSTLKYRLQRIREISGHDLNDAGANFNLQLATRAWNTLLALRRCAGSPGRPSGPGSPGGTLSPGRRC